MNNKTIYSLIPLEKFKALLGIDDREDNLAQFCLVTSTYTIEEYCKRKLLRKKHFEWNEYDGDLLIPLREYPVSQLLSVNLYGNGVENPHPCGFSTMEFATQTPAKALVTPPSVAGILLEPDFYNVIPDCGTDYDLPFRLVLSRAIQRQSGISSIKAVYWAGYVVKPHPCGFTTRSFCDAKTPAKALNTAASMPPVPPDLSAACLELASWNMNRYRGRRVGMSGIVRGGGKDGEHFELSMPENVKQLLEPHRRKVI
jgi:hypothetical protein